MNFPVVWTIFFFAHCFYIINGGPTYFNVETLEVSHRSDLFVPGEDYTGKHRHLGPGGARGAGPPLELRFYRVKFFKVGKISFFVLVGPPWVKIVPRPLEYLPIICSQETDRPHV